MGLLRAAVSAAQRRAPLAPAVGAGARQLRGIYSTGHGCEEYESPVNGAPRIYSPWNKWFPYEPVPCSPKLGPYAVKVQAGQEYRWCACGESASQPWCDESCGPGGRASPGFKAVSYVPMFTRTEYLCGCKHSGQKTQCNGTCKLMWIDQNTVAAGAMGFVGSFFFGIFLTWMMHP